MFLYIYVCTDIEKRPHRVHCDVTVGNRTGDSIYTKQEKVQQKKKEGCGGRCGVSKTCHNPTIPFREGTGLRSHD